MKFYLDDLFETSSRDLGVSLYYYDEPWYSTKPEKQRCYVEVCSETKLVIYNNFGQFINVDAYNKHLNKKFLNYLHEEIISD